MCIIEFLLTMPLRLTEPLIVDLAFPDIVGVSGVSDLSYR